MPKMDISDVRARVRVAIHNRWGHPWFPGLAEPLTKFAWHQLKCEIGLTPCSYGTARLISKNPGEVRLIAALCSAGSKRGVGCDAGKIPIEILPPDVAQKVIGYNTRLMGSHTLAESVALQMEEALSYLTLVPTVWPTVCTLVRSLHIIDPGGDETDVSFSDPALPFSAFVSVPSIWSEVGALRVAEAILHEAMHLQLTLVERVVPLVVPHHQTYYSPWRGEVRDSEGILQALYVFGVIRSFLRLMLVGYPQRDAVREHLVDRITQIDNEIEQVQGFHKLGALTSDGAALAVRISETVTARGLGGQRDQ